MASVRCVDGALGFTGTIEGMAAVGTGDRQIPVQGNNLRNIIEGADLVMSHILHFYHLAALDYINTTNTPVDGQAPWSPKDNTADMIAGTLATALVLQYVTALDIRREAHRMGAYVSGKQPCTPALIPGGVTKTVPAGSTAAADMTTILTGIRSFIDNTYIPTVVVAAKALSGSLLVGSDAQGVGRGCKKYLAYGTFPTSSGTQVLTGGFANCTAAAVSAWTVAPLNPAFIEEHVTYSYYDPGTLNIYDKLHPSVGMTKPLFGKAGAYSWLKAPRYQTAAGSANTHVCEVGPLARMIVNTLAGVEPWASTVTNFITSTLGLPLTTGLANLPSVLGRHAARALECKGIADTMPSWIAALGTTTATGQSYKHRNIPTVSSTGYGLTEAPRGALGHWIRVDGSKVSNYQAVVPTTWNASPKDSYGQNGTIEQAIMGTALTDDATGRTKIGRIIRSFDPCIACAVHIVSGDKKTISKFEVIPNGFSSCK
ncbi:MAG: nickel-dependent hydrogenase large subunit [Thermodesulfovibrionales bacterium]